MIVLHVRVFPFCAATERCGIARAPREKADAARAHAGGRYHDDVNSDQQHRRVQRKGDNDRVKYPWAAYRLNRAETCATRAQIGLGVECGGGQT